MEEQYVDLCMPTDTLVEAVTRLQSLSLEGGEAGCRDYLIQMILSEISEREGITKEEVLEWPGFDYQGACIVLGLNSWERLNSLNFNKESNDLDELYDDELASYKTSVDWEEVASITKIQIEMERIQLEIERISLPVWRERGIAKSLLNKHYHIYDKYKREGKSKEHYEKLQALKLRNTTARESAMALGRNPVISNLWEAWNELSGATQVRDPHSWVAFFSIAPQGAPRKKRVRWMQEWLESHEEYTAHRERENPLNPYWIDRDDDGRCDDYSIHDSLLNRGDDLSYLDWAASQEKKDIRDTVLWNPPSNVGEIEWMYNEWLTGKYKEWFSALNT